MNPTFRTLIVDDSSLFRRTLTNIMGEISNIEIVGTAADGTLALSKAADLMPDLITLDIEMPKLNGLETLRGLKEILPGACVVMVSSLTRDGAEITLQTLEEGAFDFITKPEYGDSDENIRDLTSQLCRVVKAISRRRKISSLLNGADAATKKPKASPSVCGDVAGRMAKIVAKTQIKIVGIAISTGGPQALTSMIPELKKNINIPITVVQHMPPMFTKALAESLDRKSELTVIEAPAGERVEPNFVYIAPGGKQMKINSENRIVITDDPPENYCKPAADYLFRSIANVYRNSSLGVIMTGMGADGVLGLRLMKRHGVQVIAQDESSCIVYGMPGEAVKAGVVDHVVPLANIAKTIMDTVNDSK